MTNAENCILRVASFCPLDYEKCPDGYTINLEFREGFQKYMEESFEKFFFMVPQGIFVHLFVHRIHAPIRNLLFHISNKYKKNIALYEGLNMNDRGSGFVNGGWIITGMYSSGQEMPDIKNMGHAHQIYFSRHPMDGGLDPQHVLQINRDWERNHGVVDNEESLRELLRHNLAIFPGNTVILYGTLFPKLRHSAIRGSGYWDQINLILAEPILKEGIPESWVPTSTGLFALKKSRKKF